MEETKDEPADARSERSNDENFTWDEWTVIDDGENSNNRKTSQSVRFDEAALSDTSFSDIDDTSDAEEARECTDVASRRVTEERTDETEDVERCNDESDGVSVITESEADEPVHGVNEGALVVYRSDTGTVVDSLRHTEIDNLRMMKTLQIFLVFCCLLGLGILCIAINNGVSRNSNGNDLAGNTRCNSLFETVDETTDENRIAREIASLKRKAVYVDENFRNRTSTGSKQLLEVKDRPSANDPPIVDPDSALFERLQIFLRTMCSLTKDIRYAATTDRRTECETRLPELIDLRSLLRRLASELDASERSGHEKFLRNLDRQIESASDELVADFARALDKLTSKNNRKIDKISHRLAERLCVLRNTLPSDSVHRETLERSNTFVEKCGSVATMKFDGLQRQDTKRVKKSLKGRVADRGNGVDGKSRGHSSKRLNDTRTIDRSPGSGDNPWDTRECNRKGLPNVATLLPPPISSCGLKRKSSPTAKHQKDTEGAGTIKDYSGKHRWKGDRGASKGSKAKSSKDFNKRNNRKQSTPSSSVEDDVHRMERTTESRTVLSGPRSVDADIKYKRIYPSGPTGRRENKRFEKEDHEFILLDRKDDKETMRKNGHWQFDRFDDVYVILTLGTMSFAYRSQIRDKLRKHNSRSNWYFDRVGNWQFVRSEMRDKLRENKSGSNWYFDRAGNRRSSRNELQ